MALGIGTLEYPFGWRNLCICGRTSAANHEASGGLSGTADESVAAYSPLVEDVIDVPLLRGESVTFEGVDLNTLFFKYGANGSGGTSATDFVTIVGYSFP